MNPRPIDYESIALPLRHSSKVLISAFVLYNKYEYLSSNVRENNTGVNLVLKLSVDYGSIFQKLNI